MKFDNIKIYPVSGGFHTVEIDGKFADHLTKDEVLGVIASALFSDKAIFVQSYEERMLLPWMAKNKISALIAA